MALETTLRVRCGKELKEHYQQIADNMKRTLSFVVVEVLQASLDARERGVLFPWELGPSINHSRVPRVRQNKARRVRPVPSAVRARS